MLTENEVVESITKYLQNNGYDVLQSLNTSDKGVDIIAKKDGKMLYIEAKGATSSKEGSSRYGKGFSKNQVQIHIAVAVLASIKILSSKKDATTGIALPDNQDHRDLISAISPVLKRLKIIVYWVNNDSVAEE